MASALCRMAALGCGLSFLQGGSAWLPVSPRAATTARPCPSRPLQAAAEESVGGGGRPDLVSMKRSFETSMDNKLIMEYVTVSVCFQISADSRHMFFGWARAYDTCFRIGAERA